MGPCEPHQISKNVGIDPLGQVGKVGAQFTCRCIVGTPRLQTSEVHADSSIAPLELRQEVPLCGIQLRIARLGDTADIVSGRNPQPGPGQFPGYARVVQAPEVAYAYRLEPVVPVVAINEDDRPVGRFEAVRHDRAKKNPGVWQEPDPGRMKTSLPWEQGSLTYRPCVGRCQREWWNFISQSSYGIRGSVRLALTATVPAPQPRTVRLPPGAGIGTMRATGTFRLRISTTSPTGWCRRRTPRAPDRSRCDAGLDSCRISWR